MMKIESEYLELQPKKEVMKIVQGMNFSPDDYDDVISRKRILEASREEDWQKNCFGTAQFLNEDIEEDFIQWSAETFDRICKKENEIDAPKIRCYIVFDGVPDIPKAISHMGVIVSLNPLKIMHRAARQGQLRVDELADIKAHFEKMYLARDPDHKGVEVRYYLRSSER